MRCPESLFSRSSGIWKHMDWHCGEQLTEHAQAWRSGSFHSQLVTLLKSGQPRLLSGRFDTGKTGTGILHQFLWTCFLPVQCYKCGHDQGQLRKSENLRVSLQKPCFLMQQDDWVSRGAPQQANMCVLSSQTVGTVPTRWPLTPMWVHVHTQDEYRSCKIFLKRNLVGIGGGGMCV